MHDFIIIDYNNIPEEISYSLSKSPDVFKKISITDKFILKNYKVLSKNYALFEAYWNETGNKKRGLSYYGITIFDHEMILKFIDSLKYIKDCDEKNSLIDLCEIALENHMYLIHFGI